MGRAPLETEEELQRIKAYLLLPVLLDVLEKDTAALKTVPLKMSSLYIKALRRVQDKSTRDLAETRRMLRLGGIKVYAEKRTSHGIEAEYLCRGYHRFFSLGWSLVRAEMETVLSRYLNMDLGESG